MKEYLKEIIKKQPKKYINFTLARTFVEADGGGGYLWEAYFGEGISAKNHLYASGMTPEEALQNLLKELCTTTN